MIRKRIIIATALVVGLSVLAQAQNEKPLTERVSLNGDLRLRGESIDQEGEDVRNRFRLRARVGITGDVTDEVKVMIRLASGGDDPVSANQSLDEGFSTKDIRLDRAYIAYRPEVVEGLEITAGKMRNPFIRVNNLMWDTDLNPDGAAFKYSRGEDRAELLFTGGAMVVEERSSDEDTFLFAGQAAVDLDVTESASVLAGTGFFYYDNLLGFSPVFDPENAFGNTTTGGGADAVGDPIPLAYANEYGIVEVFGKASIDVGLPVLVYGQFLNNTEADHHDTGYLLGATLGKAEDPGSWQLDYNFRDLEADAALGVFVDSDSSGGGTNIESHRLQGKYQLTANLQVVLTGFVGALDPDGEDTDYQQGQLDLVARF